MRWNRACNQEASLETRKHFVLCPPSSQLVFSDYERLPLHLLLLTGAIVFLFCIFINRLLFKGTYLASNGYLFQSEQVLCMQNHAQRTKIQHILFQRKTQLTYEGLIPRMNDLWNLSCFKIIIEHACCNRDKNSQ